MYVPLQSLISILKSGFSLIVCLPTFLSSLLFSLLSCLHCTFLSHAEAVATVHPVDQTGILPGDTIYFSVTATGTAPLSYQWQKDGEDLNDGGSITGATTATLTITGVMMESDEGGYRCVVTNIAGTNTSNIAVLTVIGKSQIVAWAFISFARFKTWR